jgi:hypothetical protein
MSKILELLKKEEGKTFSSPRARAIDYTISKVNEDNQNIVIHFSSGTSLYLNFRTFNAVIDYLRNNANRFVRVGGTTNKSSDKDTLEYVIQSLEPYTDSHTKRAPHVCDILNLGGFIEYGKARNPKTNRLNQAVKWNYSEA